MAIKKVVLVTGSSRGIGQAIAEGFACKGYAVALHGRKANDALRRVKKNIISQGGTADIFRADVSDSDAVGAMVKNIINLWGHIDILINNAGIISRQVIPMLSSKNWDELMSINLKGVFLCTKAVSRYMVKAYAGAIINIGSIQGVRGGKGTAAYASSKGGVISFTKTTAQELGKWGITVNAVLPGYHATSMEYKDYEIWAKEMSVLGTTPDINELVSFIILLSGMKTISGQIFNWDSRII